MSKFVIRGYNWGYHGKAFYPCGSYIQSIFNDEIEAKKEKVKLERAHWREADLGVSAAFCDGDETLVSKMNDFVEGKLGKTLLIEGNTQNTYVPQELGSADFLTFLDMAGLEAYKLTRFDDEPRFYALRMTENKSYLMEYDGRSTALVFGVTVEELKRDVSGTLAYELEDCMEPLKGSLESLSETPDVLNDFLGSTSGFAFNKKRKIISIKKINASKAFSFNELLKKPLFTVESLSIEDVQNIQAKIDEGAD